MKQHLLAIIAVLAAIILALFSIETGNNPKTRMPSYNTCQRVCQPASDELAVPVAGENHHSPQQEHFVSVGDNPYPLPVGTQDFVETQNVASSQSFASLHHTAMTALSPTEIPPLDAGMVNVTSNSEFRITNSELEDGGGTGNEIKTVGYRVDIQSMPIAQSELHISIPYDPSLLPAGFTEDDIQTYVYDRQYQRWVAIQRDSVNEVELLVYSRFSRNPFVRTNNMYPSDVETFHEMSLQTPTMNITDFMQQMGEGGGDSPLDFINAVLKTPEMPETSAYTPTSIKELKAADPLEGLTLMQPPTANNSGTANLSYPIEIPAGRQGMQPNLALTYSSGGGNGWLGVGWDIPIPSITVETRWGVPRYDQSKESEVYVYEGEQLVTKDGSGNFRPMPHRTNQWTNRSTLGNEEQFFPRKNEDFDSIVRHGDGPSNYWWSVTHKNGVTDYYGKKHNSGGVDYNSVLCDPDNHNIAQWMLTESVDPHGNWVRYYYHTELQQNVYNQIGYNKGVQIYIDSIQYTGHALSAPKYSVRFNLKENNRKDIIINGRYGFREVTAATLCNVEVFYKDTILRQYLFVTENTRESNFKTRLTDLVRMDPPMQPITCDTPYVSRYWTNTTGAGGALEVNKSPFNLTRYNFDYYNYPDQDSLFSAWKTLNDEKNDNDLHAAFKIFQEPATALGATRGYSCSAGGTLTIGVADKNLLITDFNVGGNFSYGYSATEGLLTLIDLDGDGLADKVYKRNNGVCYRPQVIDDTDSLSFHFGEAVPIQGIQDFLFEESHQPSFGLQGSVMSVVAASAGLPTTISTTPTYFTDINGDGLPDLVTDQGALFNSLDIDGHPYFTPVNSYRTDSDDGSVNTSQVIVTSATAPCGGIIFDGETDPNINCDYYFPIDSTECFALECDYSLSYLQANYNTLPIGFADSFYHYYLIDSMIVACDPMITDPDLDAVRVWVAPFDGNISVYSDIRMKPDSSEGFQQSRYSNGVRYSVEQNTNCWVDTNMLLHSQSTAVLKQGALDKIDTDNISETIITYVHKYDILFFRIQSKKDRSYDNVEWDVEIEYDDISGTNDEYGRPKNRYYSYKDYVLTGQHLFEAPKKGTVTLSGELTGDPGNNAGKLYITHGSYMDSLDIVANTFNNITINKVYTLAKDDIVMFEIKGNGNSNIIWGDVECRPYLTFREDTNDHSLYVPDELSCYPPVRLAIRPVDQSDTIVALRKFFGPLYRGWGEFAYKNDSLSVYLPIDLASLRLPKYLSEPSYTLDSATVASAMDTTQFHLDTVSNTTDISVEALAAAIDTIFNPLSDSTRWVEMNPDMEHYSWAGFGNTTAVSREMMSNTRPKREIAVLNGDDYPSDMTVTQEIIEYDHPVPVSVNGYPVQTIRKMNVSVMGNGSLSVIGSEGEGSPALSVGGSVSGGSNFVFSDYLDLNGDRYPDMLCKKSVQYTMPWGGIGTRQILNPEQDELCNSDTRSGGGSFSGSYPIPKRQAGGNAQKAKITIDGLGASMLDGEDETSVMYLDINGDGLPDRVYKDGLVALNTGYGFDIKEQWYSGTPRTGSSLSTSANLGANFSFEQISIGGGLGINQSESITESQLLDFNGDGLPDKVSCDNGSLIVKYNIGKGIWSPADVIAGLPHINQSQSFSETGNGSLTLGFEIGPFVKIQVGVQLSPFNSTFSRDNAQLTDINGDGYPDFVTSSGESNMSIRYNTAGKTNLLRQVTNFTGNTITLDYDMPLSCYEKPQRGWNLASVEVNDPASPLPSARTLTRFTYAEPHYNRYERMDFGYGQVKTFQYDTDGDSLYRYTVEEFENHSFAKRGRKLRDCVYDAADSPYVEHLYFATVFDHSGTETVDTGCAQSDLYVGHEAELTLFYEGGSAPKIVTRVSRDYDRYRNVVRYVHYGDTTHNKDFFVAEIDYDQGKPHYQVSLPVRIQVKDKDSTVIRLRTASYTDSGNLKKLVNYSTLTDSSELDFTYDDYGNLSSSKLPKNTNGQRLQYTYHYDSEVHIYPVQVKNNSLGFTSTAVYDCKFGKPIRTTDINGNDMRYAYDYMGRLSEVLAPYEADSGGHYTIKMTYFPKNFDRWDIFTPDTIQSYACTFHYDPTHPNNNLRTVVLSDGLGRLLQTKKDAEINGIEMCMVTGRVVYDCFGRRVAQYQPFTETLGREAFYDDSLTAGTQTVTRYDILDRRTYVKTPLNLVSTMEYGFDTCGGHRCFATSVTDPMHNTVKTLTGTLGQQLKQIAPLNTVTRFDYDCFGRLEKNTDPDNFSTFYTYDMLGRLVQRAHPDAGTDRYHYDAAGNLTSHVNAMGDSILYRYHYHQLKDVEFPRYPANNVHYHYGTASDANINAVGKVVLQEDASGWQKFSYGKLGEVVQNIRTFALPFENQTYTFKMNYEYDSWNRIQKITYPDSEVVRYGYNLGGMLSRVTGSKGDTSYRYIDSIAYNEFELKEAVFYGNGTYASYRYDSLQRLIHLYSECAGGVMQEIDYDYDEVSNIVGIVNNAVTLPNGLGGAYSNSHEYDNLYRLTGSAGGWQGVRSLNYLSETQYHANGRIKSKKLAVRTLLNGISDSVNYTRSYSYAEAKPNTLVQINSGSWNEGTLLETAPEELSFAWDATGNMVTQLLPGDNRRLLCWDEQNRLLGVKDDGHLSYYQYDANGDRTYKLTGKGDLQNISGSWQTYYQLENATLYASPYVVATGRGYTKHYYAEAERIASRIGGGGLHDLDRPVVEQGKIVEKKSANKTYAKEVMEECLDAIHSEDQAELYHLYDMLNSIQSETDCYWYHPDHLGSSSWITDSAGTAVQHLHYLPWGEDFVDQRTTTWSARFTFSAKEKDPETGLSYFGSRYYSSNLSIWLSVDPMSDKYASLSPYVYCADNPVKLTDPDGRWIPGLDEDNNIVVTREEGDDLSSFKKFMGPAYNDDDIQSMYSKMQDAKINLTKTYGKEFQIMTDAINDAKKDPYFTQTKNYNCWGASLALMRGDRLYGSGTDPFIPWSRDGVGIDSPILFDLALSNYDPIKQESASVGKTIMRFGPPILGMSTHASIFLGVDNSGNEYTFSKNGWNARPVVYNSRLLGYGIVMGRSPQEPGYYVKK